MKKFAVLLLLLSAYGLNAAQIPQVDECVIKDAWLYKNYDTHPEQIRDIKTDFFLLRFSNSPSFCDYKRSKHQENDVPFQCQSPSTKYNHFQWVVHGLWGENRQAYQSGNNNGHPQYCQGDLPKLKLTDIKPYLCMSPGTSLLQHEWEKHGACDFDSAQAYFQQVKALRSQFVLPSASLDARQAVRWMKANNPALANTWLDQTNHEFGICFTTNFQIMNCPRKR
ncbi:ribonuclease T2 family protein [Vibrio mangrovi]|uniref:Ribonuclease T2 family protein n=1 Tax=Vibrio mangrovi TaxID=474394 RepID=A0A1Y6IR03_9VIBR|nr:hypothetical protein [Vibrio mangrovi]MDW6003974.1 hypothetical protein [Vibrio mangrovi]SMR99230.1 Ribonuclease T2 family protein [Vibrio mangrovi]